jgi:hypothetical protein
MSRGRSVFAACGFALALLGAACGDDSSGGSDAGQGDHEHDAGGSIAVPCEDVQPLYADTVVESAAGHYKVLVIDTDPFSPPRKKISEWLVEIQDADGQPLEAAEVLKVKPVMPAHSHTSILVPEIESAGEPGRFTIGNVNLWMSGPWVVTFELSGPAGPDKAVFDVCIED